MRLDDDRYAHQENIVITVEDFLRVCDCAHERRMIAEMGTMSRSSILRMISYMSDPRFRYSTAKSPWQNAVIQQQAVEPWSSWSCIDLCVVWSERLGGRKDLRASFK